MKTPAHDQLTFIRIGGAWQPMVTGFRDFPALLALDAAHWGMTSIATDLIRIDRRFLAYLDSDNNGQIRVKEVRDALAFMIGIFENGGGIDRKSDVLELAALNPENPDAAKILAAARLILSALGKPDATELSLTEVMNEKKLNSSIVGNGDGVVTAVGTGDPKLAALVETVIRYAGGAPDLSGDEGVDAAALDRLEERLKAWLAWKQADTFTPDDTAVFAAAEALAPALDAYFLNSEAMAFLADDPERLAPRSIAADVRSATEVGEALNQLVIAAPDAAGELDVSAGVNPLYREKLTALFGMKGFAPYLKKGRLSAASWRAFRAAMKQYNDHLAAQPETVFDDEDAEKLAKPAAAKQLARLRELMEDDLAVGQARSGDELLLKALLFQRNLLDFLNNFINLSELFTPDGLCMLQSGTLVMDARRFTLAVPVKNPTEHRTIAAPGYICVAYIEITRKLAAAPGKQLLAVAITSGSMRNLFVGKRGVFFDAEGVEYDAQIVQFLDQPVSIPDALIDPFRKFAAFVGKQFDKLFSSRAGEAQNSLGADLSSGKAPAANGSALNGSMLLMGGGIGLAALGSALAFIVKALQDVSLWKVLVILLCIILIFGGPGVIISLYKLFRRNLARYFEASGCALNRNMRMSFALGRVFTHEPNRPEGSRRMFLTPAEEPGERRSRWGWWLLLLLVIALAVGGGWYWKTRCREKACPAQTPAAECTQATEPAPAAEPAPAPAPAPAAE